jgi:hypothetical protein
MVLLIALIVYRQVMYVRRMQKPSPTLLGKGTYGVFGGDF